MTKGRDTTYEERIALVHECLCDTIRYKTDGVALFAYGGDSGTQRNFPKNTTR